MNAENFPVPFEQMYRQVSQLERSLHERRECAYEGGGVRTAIFVRSRIFTTWWLLGCEGALLNQYCLVSFLTENS